MLKYIYDNPGRLPIPQLPARDLSPAEFDAVVGAYAVEFPGELLAEVAKAVLDSGYYVRVSDEEGTLTNG